MYPFEQKGIIFSSEMFIAAFFFTKPAGMFMKQNQMNFTLSNRAKMIENNKKSAPAACKIAFLLIFTFILLFFQWTWSSAVNQRYQFEIHFYAILCVQLALQSSKNTKKQHFSMISMFFPAFLMISLSSIFCSPKRV